MRSHRIPPSHRPETLPGSGRTRWDGWGIAVLHACLGAVWVCATLFCPTAPAHAAPAPIASSPIPRPGMERIRGRGEKELLLKVVGDSIGVDFELNTSATRGTLKSLNGNSSQLKYTPPADRSILRDSFLFRARRGQSYSTWETFHIALLEAGAQLQVPQTLDFGMLRLGESKSLPVVLSNSGDAPAQEEISIQPPWKLNPPLTQIQIAPDQQLALEVRVRAESVGKMVGELSVGRGNSYAAVRLHMEVAPWIEAAPERLLLKTASSETASPRSAEITLRNPNPHPETFQIDSKGQLQHPPEIHLQPGERRPVPLQLRSPGRGQHKGLLVVRGAPAGPPPELERTRVIPWEAPAFPPSLQKQLKATTDPKTIHSVLLLTNAGGKSGTWKISCTGPFALGSTNALDVTLDPEQTREIPIRHVPTAKNAQSPPSLEGQIQFSGTDGQTNLSLQNRASSSVAVKTAPLPRAEPVLPQDKPLQAPTPPTPSPQKAPSTAPVPPPPSDPAAKAAEVVRFSNPSQVQILKAPAKSSPKQADVVRFSETDESAEPAPRSEADQLMVRQILSERYIPFIDGIALKDITPHTATLLLPFPQTPPKNFPLLFEGQFKVNVEGTPERVWKPLKYNDPIRDAAGRLEYRIRDLEPASTVTLRILGPLLENGKRQAIHQQDFRTPPKLPNLWLRPVILGTLLLVALAAWMRVRRGT